MQFVSQTVATILGSGIALAVSVALSKHALNEWGFRVPFLLGLLIAPVGIYVRRHVDETPAYEAAIPHAAPVAELFGRHWLRMALAACVIAGGTAGT